MIKKLLWGGVKTMGVVVNSSGWLVASGNNRYLNGYVSKRTLIYGEHEYEILCKIYESTTKRPLFECVLSENQVQKGRAVATNPTTAVKKVFKSEEIVLSFHSGNTFFGINREDVKDLEPDDELQLNININKKLIALRFPRICLIYAPNNLKRLSEIT